jgi:arginine/lysine/ornithine decarboxylase
MYYVCHLVVTYGLLFWGNSSHSTEVLRLQKEIIRIMMGARSRVSSREFFKISGILPLMAQYIYSITMFVVNNRDYFKENSKLYDIKTRYNKNLFQPQSNSSVYQRNPLYADIKIHNILPIQIKLLSSNFNQFKRALKDFLQLHSFYTLAEYLNYNRG